MTGRTASGAGEGEIVMTIPAALALLAVLLPIPTLAWAGSAHEVPHSIGGQPMEGGHTTTTTRNSMMPAKVVTAVPDAVAAAATAVRSVNTMLYLADVSMLGMPEISTQRGGGSYTPPPRPTMKEVIRIVDSSSGPRRQLKVLTIADIRELASRQQSWLIEGVLQPGETMIVYGDAKSKKSILTMKMAYCLSTATPFLGFTVPQRAPTHIVQAEDTDAILWDRIQQIAGADPDGLPITFVRERLQLGTSESFEDLVASIPRTEGQPGLLIIDPFFRVCTENENSAKTMTAFLNSLSDIARQTGWAVVLVHHVSKKKGARGAVMRGSTAFTAAVDVLMSVERDKDDRHIIMLEMDGRRYFTGGKITYRIDKDPIMQFIPLDREDDEDDGNGTPSTAVAQDADPVEEIRTALPLAPPGVRALAVSKVVHRQYKFVCDTLHELERQGKVRYLGQQRGGGWIRVEATASSAVPVAPSATVPVASAAPAPCPRLAAIAAPAPISVPRPVSITGPSPAPMPAPPPAPGIGPRPAPIPGPVPVKDPQPTPGYAELLFG